MTETAKLPTNNPKLIPKQPEFGRPLREKKPAYVGSVSKNTPSATPKQIATQQYTNASSYF